jgi:hypothetical protein
MDEKDRLIEYWKQRAQLAERVLDGAFTGTPNPDVSEVGTRVPTSNDPSQCIGDEALEALNLLCMNRIEENETATEVVSRLLAYVQDRVMVVSRAKHAGYQIDDDLRIGHVCAPLVERLLRDLSSGRQMIEFLSRPPAMRVDELPVGAVFTSNGRLLEVRRERTDGEACVVCYEWNRDERPAQVDRKQLVQPIGKVVFDDRRKTIKLGLLEFAQAARSTLDTESPPPLLPEPK